MKTMTLPALAALGLLAACSGGAETPDAAEETPVAAAADDDNDAAVPTPAAAEADDHPHGEDEGEHEH